jgi:integrin alpha FG-GAP repeat containing protein 1
LKEDFLIGVSDPIIAGFFDFSENGKLDLIISAGNETNSRLLVRENSEVIEANFLKIIMSSGRCPPDGCDRNTGWMWSLRDVEGYSSNIPGAQVTYLMDDINGVKRAATSGQLKQSSHFALETPYMLFGLGELANYVEALNITLPSPQNNEDEKGLLHTMEQIIPDAHIIIVPRPLNEAKNWKAKLYFTVGDRIKRTVYTLLAICAALVLVIAVLHKKELREDAPEAKEFRQNWLDRR